MDNAKDSQLEEFCYKNALTSEIEDKYTGILTRSLYRLKSLVDQRSKKSFGFKGTELKNQIYEANNCIVKINNLANKLSEIISESETIICELKNQAKEIDKIVKQKTEN